MCSVTDVVNQGTRRKFAEVLLMVPVEELHAGAVALKTIGEKIVLRRTNKPVEEPLLLGRAMLVKTPMLLPVRSYSMVFMLQSYLIQVPILALFFWILNVVWV